jgi:hypothetical protein
MVEPDYNVSFTVPVTGTHYKVKVEEDNKEVLTVTWQEEMNGISNEQASGEKADQLDAHQVEQIAAAGHHAVNRPHAQLSFEHLISATLD